MDKSWDDSDFGLLKVGLSGGIRKRLGVEGRVCRPAPPPSFSMKPPDCTRLSQWPPLHLLPKTSQMVHQVTCPGLYLGHELVTR